MINQITPSTVVDIPIEMSSELEEMSLGDNVSGQIMYEVVSKNEYSTTIKVTSILFNSKKRKT